MHFFTKIHYVTVKGMHFNASRSGLERDFFPLFS